MRTMDKLLLALLAIHIFVCGICCLLTRLRILKSTYLDVFILLILPVFGLWSLLLHSRVTRDEQRRAKDLKLAELKITDSVQRSITVSDNGEEHEVVPLTEAFAVNDSETQRQMMKDVLFAVNTNFEIAEDAVQEKTIPLQEALLLNDSHTKRELIMDVLYTDPKGYVSQLSQARENDDTEVVHYAVTALVEIQKEFDLEFQKLEKKLARFPEDETLLREYQRLLERYLASGLVEGSRAEAKLRDYAKVLSKRLMRNGQSLSLWIKKADADMRLGNLDDLREDAQRMIDFREENEEGYLYLLKYYALCRDPEGTQKVIRMIDQRNIYLTAKGRADVAFWRLEEAR